ncbi:MAG: M28 family peptidase [Gemmatimonadetes bacterium]|nr:M28 family peptidase [Gemmatimonadota bacterium]
MRVYLIGLIAVAAACAAPVQQVRVQPAVPTASAALASAVESIRPQDFYARIGFLASDALEGRDTPSPGLEAAAAYIASEFYRMGLQPAGEDGTYFQRWPYVTRALDVAGVRFNVQSGGQSRSLAYRSDYYVAGGQRASFEGGMVFAGREIPAADMRGNTMRDRAVILVPSGTDDPRTRAQAITRARAAADSAGAAALIIVMPPSTTTQQIAQGATAAERASRGVPSMPVFYVRDDAARSLFQSANLDFIALTGAASARPPVPLAGVTAQLGGGITETEHRPPNVAGMVRGSDPVLRDTYLVFSAHIDHTGICAPGTADPICNGADDDASGTSAIMELAEAFAMLPVAPKRSIIFLGVSGEEKGLLGSSYYADNPTVPIESIIANINMDMIGRNNPDSVVVIGKDYSTLGPLLEQVNARHPELGMTTSDDLWPEQRFFFRSDHFNFARREVPSIFFFTGVHEDYHRPSDTVDKIDLDKITRITRLVFHYGNEIANADQAPQWDPAGLEEVRRLVSQRQ